MFLRLSAAILGTFLAVASLRAQTGDENLGLIPKPVTLSREAGAFRLATGGKILAAPGADGEAQSLAERLKTFTGVSLMSAQNPGVQSPNQAILISLDPSLKANLGDEGYQLSVHPDGITIRAATTAGLFYGGITLTQLATTSSGTAIPGVEITDYPRFEWRGMMLDSARHFQPKAFVLRLLDLMAMQKMNRFHWHLVDSEGWRLEIKKYPKLTQVTAGYPQFYPSEDPNGTDGPRHYNYGHFHGGGYYSQADVREIVAYAAARHIEIMPEIEFPAHSMAALTAYPEFSATGKPPVISSNISPDLYNVDDKSLQFLRDVLTETMDLFPGKYIHFGGDEAPKREWKESPLAQQKIKELGLKDEDALQSWMFNQMSDFVAKRGRVSVGWEEICKGGIPNNSVVMPWISMKFGFDAANSGHDIIVARQIPDYFTSNETDSLREPFRIFWGVTLPAVYNQAFEFSQIKPENASHILGAQAELWGERMRNPPAVENMAFPRSAALAESLWTPLKEKDLRDFSKRLNVMAARWDRYSPPVNYHYLVPLPFAHWSAADMTAKQGVVVFPVTDASDLQTLASGSGGAIFPRGAGKGLAIQKVDLISGDQVIASDAHEGFSGRGDQDSVYRFHFAPAGGALTGGNVTLRVTGTSTGGGGDIIIADSKVLGDYAPETPPGTQAAPPPR